MKKRLVELTLATMITVASFTGCGKSQEATAAQETTHMEVIAETAEPETESQTKQANDMVYLDEYALPKWEAPDEVCQMLDNGAVFFENTELPDMPLNDRQGKIYIEMCICQVDDITTGEGHILNYFDERWNYVNVGDMPGYDLQNGDIVVKYYIYNPDSNAEDDIIDEYSVFVTDAYRK